MITAHFYIYCYWIINLMLLLSICMRVGHGAVRPKILYPMLLHHGMALVDYGILYFFMSGLSAYLYYHIYYYYFNLNMY